MLYLKIIACEICNLTISCCSLLINNSLLIMNYYNHNFIIIIALSLLFFTGDHCTDDYDGCEDMPCFHGTNCTDLSPEQQLLFNRAYNCSECPEGYYKPSENLCVGKLQSYVVFSASGTWHPKRRAYVSKCVIVVIVVWD